MHASGLLEKSRSHARARFEAKMDLYTDAGVTLLFMTDRTESKAKE